MIVVSVVTVVKTGMATGMPINQLTDLVAPLFPRFGHIAIAAACLAAITDLADLRLGGKPDKLSWVRLLLSSACLIGTIIFALDVIPQMERLRPQIWHDIAAHQLFDKLHHTSRIVLSSIIGLSLFSLLTSNLKRQDGQA